MCHTVWSSMAVAFWGVAVSHRNARRFSTGTYQYVPPPSPSQLHRDESCGPLPATVGMPHPAAPRAVNAIARPKTDRRFMSRSPRSLGACRNNAKRAHPASRPSHMRADFADMRRENAGRTRRLWGADPLFRAVMISPTRSQGSIDFAPTLGKDHGSRLMAALLAR